ncbi:MAG: Mo-dependent nitrogenase C-terminal domain-containing protein [Cyanobacteria bacterium]|nr:Mo-dependent nitrogenase C-terminal domain-containing protein [Cyanobacteriota bacterium]MDW8202941.1 Mo-dependent nitrogenase C-terminal domain-containing protein [Cyanobacteriota bacterium SKYGB_h_bin112]
MASWIWLQRSEQDSHNNRSIFGALKHNFQPLKPLRQWLDHIQVNDRQLAHRLCQLIPAQCPFERDIQLFGRILFHIPPLCKLNPLYDELVHLRFRALSYLADDCGEDVSAYI